MATFVLEIVTPDKTVVKDDVDMAVCPGAEGEFGILPNHEAMLAALKIGMLRYMKGGAEESLFISGGFLDMNENICSVLAESAERARDIDVARAKLAKERAEKRLAEKKDDLDETRAQIALQKAIMRISIGSKPM